MHDQLGIAGLADLEKALLEHRVQALKGFGAKLEAEMQKGIAAHKLHRSRTRLDLARAEAEAIAAHLSGTLGVERIQPAGSLRRWLETVGDLDILVTGAAPGPAMARFVGYPKVKEVLARGETKSSIVLQTGLQVDLRFLPPESFGAGLYYFTGSRDHNIAVRKLAKAKGWKVSEYGVFKGEKLLAGKTEEGIFKLFGMAYIPPELREDRGEIAAALAKKLPRLIELKDIKGDLQVHSEASDGRNTLAELAAKAKSLGYQYLGITDHSPGQRQANGLSIERMQKHIAAIRKLSGKLQGLTLLAGAEVDILKDGRLDYPADLLKKLEVVLGSIHGNFNLPALEQTRRVVKALESGRVHIFSHPSTRLIGEREPIELDWEPITRACLKHNVAVEINASPLRLDVNGERARALQAAGVKLVISTDAHSLVGLHDMIYGVYTARRGWVEAKDVINTWPLGKLQKWLKR
jgi:DNA polymerase (family 10)